MNEEFCKEVAKALVVAKETTTPYTGAHIQDRFPFIDNIGYTAHVLLVDSEDLSEAIEILRLASNVSTPSNEKYFKELIEEYEADFSPGFKG